MAKRKSLFSQLNNLMTYEMYKRQMLDLAENVIVIKHLPELIDLSYVNRILLRQGSIAFFVDEVLGLLALPYQTIGPLDIYGRPLKIRAYSSSNSYSKILKRSEFVIMYDNNLHLPLFLDVCQYAERISQIVRTSDINIAQQKCPRIFKTSAEQKKTIEDLINNIDSYENTVVTYDGLDLEETNTILAPAPYVADKLDIKFQNVWAEFLRRIGIANLQYQKRERQLQDEISAMQGGTIASRFSRFEPRLEAIRQINDKFGAVLSEPITLEYYDGAIPTEDDSEDSIDDFDDEGADENVSI